jgi:hypothetical protein
VSAGRQLALRLALYLDCSGIAPIVTGYSYKQYCDALSTQLMALEPEVRKRGRREGRKLIREAPGLQKAAGHLVPVPPRTPARPGKSLLLYEKYKRRMLLWPPETPPCPNCRIWGKPELPKRSWPSWEIAEQVRLLQNEPDLRVYQCPANSEYWHLGHVKRSLSAGNLKSS